jgi:hypothetical protein
MAVTPKRTGFMRPPPGVDAPCLDDAAIADMGAIELKKICRDGKLHQGVAVAFNDDEFAPANNDPENLDVAHLVPSRAPTTPRSGAFLKSKLRSLKTEYNRVRSLDGPSTEPLWPYRVFYATTFEAGLEAAPSHGRPF